MTVRGSPMMTASAVLAIAVAPAAEAGDARDVTLVPHRAVYEFSLIRSASGSGVTDAAGRMVYELSGSACEGYTQNSRYVTRLSNQEGGQTLNDQRSSNFEDGEGSKLRFSSSQYVDEKLAESTQGDAARKPAGNGASVVLVKPKKHTIKLPTDVYFPIQHMRTLIAAAQSGKTFLAAKLYEGGEKGDKYYLTTAVIGPKSAPGVAKTTAAFKPAGALDGVASWPVSISYFEAGKDKSDATPAYELSFRAYENGVSSDLKIDTGELAVKGELSELTLLEAAKCAGAH